MSHRIAHNAVCTHIQALRALLLIDAACGTHDGTKYDVGPSAIGKLVDAERFSARELRALTLQALLNARRGRQHRTLEDALLLEARKQVGEELGFDAQFFALMGIELGRRIKRHGNVVVAIHVEYDMTENLEVLANLLVAVDILEAR